VVESRRCIPQFRAKFHPGPWRFCVARFSDCQCGARGLPYLTAVRDDRRKQGTVNREDAVVPSHDESHYARAKYLVGRKAKRVGPRLPGGQLRDATDEEIAQAQVHATLALVDVMRELLSELTAGRQRDSDSQVQ
jgi:hypothetical protein